MTLRPYLTYKASGVPWLGRVPEHWRLLRAKWAVTLVNEKVDGIGDDQNYVALENIAPWTARRISSDTPVTPESQTNQFSKGNVLFGKLRPYLAKVLVAAESGYCSTELLVLQEREVSSEFLKYWCLSASFIKTVDSSTYGSKMPRASWDFIGNLPTLIPPKEEQRAIAAFLDRETAKIDALIDKKLRLMDLLKEKRAALITRVVTRGLNPDVLLKDSGVAWLGQIPAHWEIKRLKHLGEVRTGVAKGRDLGDAETINVPYLRVANVQDGYLDLSDMAELEIEPSELGRFALKAGDVLMNEGGDNDKLGRGHVWRAEITPCIHQNHVFAVRPSRVESEWIAWFSCGHPARYYFQTRAKQTTNLASISSRNIQELPVLVPPARERSDIVKMLRLQTERWDELGLKVETAITRLHEFRSSLITAVVTGKIDVRQAVPQPAIEAA